MKSEEWVLSVQLSLLGRRCLRTKSPSTCHNSCWCAPRAPQGRRMCIYSGIEAMKAKPVKAVSDRPPQPYQLAHQGTRALQSWTPISSANEARSVCDCAEMIYEQWHKVMQAICKHGDIVVSCYKSRPHAKLSLLWGLSAS